MCVYALASVLIRTLAAPASGDLATPPRQSHHAGHADRVTALPVRLDPAKRATAPAPARLAHVS
jgi:hypothetical protein